MARMRSLAEANAMLARAAPCVMFAASATQKQSQVDQIVSHGYLGAPLPAFG
jgi:hypothetical protein